MIGDERDMSDNKSWNVYIHRNIINNKAYIGITSMEPKERWGCDGANYTKKSNRVFAKAIKKYGWNNFEHIIWANNLSEEEAKRWEVRLIALFRTNVCRWKHNTCGYNMTDGGEGTTGYNHPQEVREKMRQSRIGKPMSDEIKQKISQTTTGKKLSKETKQKISDSKKGIPPSNQCLEALKVANTGKQLTEEHKQKISQALKGQKKSEETRFKISQARIGIVFSDEHREKLRQASLGHKLSEEHKQKLLQTHLGKKVSDVTKQKMSNARKGKYTGKDNSRSKPINQYDKNNVFIQSWESIQQAAKSLNLHASAISNCCIGNLKSTGGFIFKYSDIDTTPQNNYEVTE